MTYNNKPNTAVLLPNFKRSSEKAPHHTGDIYLDRSTLENALKSNQGDMITLRLAAWDQKSAKGTSYLSLKVSEPFVPSKQPVPALTPSQQAENEADTTIWRDVA
jgi:uncharacterized protein (DUF736 family)